MTDPRTRAYRIVGKVQRSLPELIVCGFVNSVAAEIKEAIEEVENQEAYKDPALAFAFLDCLKMLRNEEVDIEAARLQCKARLAPHFRK